jgi:hypothetical protein
MIDLMDDGHVYFPSNDGKHWISEKQRRINEILQDYDPNLQLQWIPPEQRTEQDKAFRVVHFPPGKRPYLVCLSEEADERLLASVFKADQKNHGKDLLSWLDNYNRAKEIYAAKANEEKRAEAREIAVSAVRSDKSSYKVRSFRDGELIDLERPGRRESSTTYIW